MAGELIFTNGMKIQPNGAGQLLIVDSSGNTVGRLDGNGLLATDSLPLTSLTNLDIAVPSWAKRVTININGMTNSASDIFIALLAGTSGFEVTGYNGGYTEVTNTQIANASTNNTVRHNICNIYDVGNRISGVITFMRLGMTSSWTISGTMFNAGISRGYSFAGEKTVTGNLTAIRLGKASNATYTGGNASAIFE